jgi:hypothetical protein
MLYSVFVQRLQSRLEFRHSLGDPVQYHLIATDLGLAESHVMKVFIAERLAEELRGSDLK